MIQNVESLLCYLIDPFQKPEPQMSFLMVSTSAQGRLNPASPISQIEGSMHVPACPNSFFATSRFQRVDNEEGAFSNWYMRGNNSFKLIFCHQGRFGSPVWSLCMTLPLRPYFMEQKKKVTNFARRRLRHVWRRKSGRCAACKANSLPGEVRRSFTAHSLHVVRPL